MKYFYLLVVILSSICLASCVSTKGIKNEKVKSAIYLQQEIIDDSLFSKILVELEKEGSIDWQEGSTSKVKENFNDYQNRAYWVLEMFQSKGSYDSSSVYLWRKWNPWSATTAVTNPCGNSTKLNKWNLKRDKYSIANTLIHERLHSFCLVHPDEQTREKNKCDISYIAGDLAEVLILKKNGIERRELNKPICPALAEKIERYNLIELE